MTSISGDSEVSTRAPVTDSFLGDLETRARFVVEQQGFSDWALHDLADPGGRRVLLIGAGAGTDILWALRHGAESVLAIDLVEQESGALEAGLEHFGLDPARVTRWVCPVEEVGRRCSEAGLSFDLLVALNVFEHLGALPAALESCYQATEPGGRMAVFSSPLFHASAGHHLEIEPWEHLWGDPERLAGELSAQLSERRSLDAVLDDMGLNRQRVADYWRAITGSMWYPLQFGVAPDRHLVVAEETRRRHPELVEISRADLAVEAVWFELIREPEAGGEATVEARSLLRKREIEAERWHWSSRVDALERELAEVREGLLRREHLLRAVDRSVSLRLGRLLTAPGRWLRRMVRS